MSNCFKHKRIAIDFDGTLFADTENIETTYINKLPLFPNPGAGEVTSWLKEQGFEILIFTCRPDYHRAYLEKQMAMHGIAHDYILFYTKPRVDLYIDDKGFRFHNWALTKDWIRNKLVEDGNLAAKSQHPNTDYEKILRKEKLKYINLDRFESILDVGCGDGDCMRGLVFGSNQIIDAVEPDSDLRDKAFLTNSYRNIYSDISEISIKDYDCVLALGVLEHVENDFEFLESLSDAKRIFCTVPNANSFHRYLGLEMGLIDQIDALQAHDHEIGHKRYYSYENLRGLIDKFTSKYQKFTLNKYGTSSFKFTSNTEMLIFKDRAEKINQVAERLGIIGDGQSFGAEIYFELEQFI